MINANSSNKINLIDLSIDCVNKFRWNIFPVSPLYILFLITRFKLLLLPVTLWHQNKLFILIILSIDPVIILIKKLVIFVQPLVQIIYLESLCLDQLIILLNSFWLLFNYIFLIWYLLIYKLHTFNYGVNRRLNKHKLVVEMLV